MRHASHGKRGLVGGVRAAAAGVLGGSLFCAALLVLGPAATGSAQTAQDSQARLKLYETVKENTAVSRGQPPVGVVAVVASERVDPKYLNLYTTPQTLMSFGLLCIKISSIDGTYAATATASPETLPYVYGGKGWLKIPVDTEHPKRLRRYRVDQLAILVELKMKKSKSAVNNSGKSAKYMCDRPREPADRIVPSTWQPPIKKLKHLRVLINSGGLWTDLEVPHAAPARRDAMATREPKTAQDPEFIECEMLDAPVVTKFDTVCEVDADRFLSGAFDLGSAQIFQGSRRGSGSSQGESLPILLSPPPKLTE